MTAGGTAFTWKKVFAALLESEPDAVAKVDVWDILHPLEVGMQRVRRQATGQIADYLLPVNSDKLCHVRDCGDLYEVRLYDVPQPQQLVAERPIKTTVLPARPVETRSLADLPAVSSGAVAAADDRPWCVNWCCVWRGQGSGSRSAHWRWCGSGCGGRQQCDERPSHVDSGAGNVYGPCWRGSVGPRRGEGLALL